MYKRIFYLVLLLIIGLQSLHAQNPEKELYLETMGKLSSQNIYMSYVYLGNIADSYIHEAITQEFCTNLLTEYLVFMKETKDQTSKLYESGFLDQEGNQVVLAQIDIYQLLIEEANAYLKYVETKDEIHIESFEQNRIWAWAKIEKLFEFKGAVGE
ncbi:MAG: hypothetical protein HN921_16670 [Bacteroidetes bacterium]|nr:hypothetical protein [Bacteroidota bacterium]MBT4969970.1 hypothetical protein [Bacteroidota bacterium]MBT5990480.1 hypothetical protein [Bacteroidota bacterium]MBT6834553.1 hypothetical protein [Bacteroidota bacterium]MBT7041464.1 hypothetical protein [Bacteroidota bacterium]